MVSRTWLLSSCVLASQRQPLSLMWHSAPEIFTSGKVSAKAQLKEYIDFLPRQHL